MIEAVGFDLDYTLVTTDLDRGTLLAEAAERADAPPVSRSDYLKAHAADLGAETRAPIFEAVLPEDAEVTPTVLARTYRELVEEALVPVPGVAELVRTLRDTYRVGLLTDGPERAQRGKLDALGWTDLFDAVVVTGPLPAGKPDAGAFEALLAALDTPPARTAFVGDRPGADIRGARRAGLRTIQVVYEGGPDPEPMADAVVDRDRLATDLPDALRSL